MGETQRRKKKTSEQFAKKVIWDKEGQVRFTENIRIDWNRMQTIDGEWRETEGNIKETLNIVLEVQEMQRNKVRKRGW